MLEAIKQHIDELEDLYQAEQRLLDVRAGRSKTHSLDDVERSLGLGGDYRNDITRVLRN